MKNWPWYGYLILAAVIFALVFFFYFKPKNEEIKGIRAERIKIEKEVEVLRAKKLELDKLENELVAMNKTLKELEAIIPRQKETADILKRIQQLAFDSRLDIRSFAPKGLINRDFYSEWPIPIAIVGNYHNLALFFDKLSRFSRIFTVDNFSIKALARQTDANTVTANWTAKTYIFREETAAPAPAKAKVKTK
jgi:Tfp pilus assembly protein PilO